MSFAIPQASIVLVTGVNGYIGSHVADQVLGAGYKVRGTARTLEKAEAVKRVLEKRHGNGKLEIVVVEDMEVPGAFDTAVEGVSGIVHVASNLSFDEDPNKVVPGVLAGITGILESAVKEPSVKRFVYTSSSTATTGPRPNEKFDITKETWNEQGVREAWAPPPYEKSRNWAVYGASKTQAEQALWKFVKDRNPHFIANAILPNANFGPLTEPNQPGSTANWVLNIYKGKTEFTKTLPPQWFVDVRDTARLHLVGLINPDVKNERIFAFAAPFTWHEIFDAVKAADPNHPLSSDPSNDDRDLSHVVERPRAVELLKTLGRTEFVTLKESVKDALEAFKKRVVVQ